MQYHFEVCFSFVSACDADYCVGNRLQSAMHFLWWSAWEKDKRTPAPQCKPSDAGSCTAWREKWVCYPAGAWINGTAMYLRAFWLDNRQCKQNVVFVLKLACASAGDFCVTHTHHAPHTQWHKQCFSWWFLCYTHASCASHAVTQAVLQLVISVLHTRIMRLTRSDTSSASAGDFCVTHTHHAPHTQWHKQCFSWWFLCYTHASCASHAVTQAVLQLVISVLHTRIMRLTRSDTSSASAGDFCVTHTHHAPHTQWHKQCFSWWFLCYTHASCASHAVTQAVLQLVISVLHTRIMRLTRSDTSSASAGDFCVTHTHHAPHTQWHKQCFSWWFLCYTHASCASHAVTQAVLQLVIFVLHTRIMRLTRSDTSSASAGDFCVTHTHHAPHTQWHKQCFSWWFLCYTHASCASHAVTQAVLQLVISVLHTRIMRLTRSDTSSASAGDFCVTHTHHAPHTQWHKQCFSWWFLCYTHASCASHAVTQAVLQLVIFVLHTRIMRLTRSDTSSASAGDFCVTHTHHAPHTQWHKQCFSWWFLCYTHASCASHAVTQAVLQLVISVLHTRIMRLTRSDTSSASAGDFCVTHTHHAPHTQWHKQCFSWWFLCYTHASCASHAVTQAVLQLVIFVLHTRIMRLTRSDTSSASAGDFCVTHTHHAPHTQWHKQCFSWWFLCYTHASCASHAVTQAVLQLVISVLHIWTMCLTRTVTQANRTSFSKSWKWTNMRVYCMACLKREVAWFKAINISYGGCENKRWRQYFTNKNTHVHEEPCSSLPNLSMGAHTHTHTCINRD